MMQAERRDIEALIDLVPLVSDHDALAPVFSGIGLAENADELRAMLARRREPSGVP